MAWGTTKTSASLQTLLCDDHAVRGPASLFTDTGRGQLSEPAERRGEAPNVTAMVP